MNLLGLNINSNINKASAIANLLGGLSILYIIVSAMKKDSLLYTVVINHEKPLVTTLFIFGTLIFILILEFFYCFKALRKSEIQDEAIKNFLNISK